MEAPAKLRWRCRRGTRELDLLLQGYLDRAYCAAAPEEQKLFEELLTLEDNLLIAYLLENVSAPTQSLKTLILKIQGC